MTYSTIFKRTLTAATLALGLMGAVAARPAVATASCDYMTGDALAAPTNRTFTATHGGWEWSVAIPSNFRAMGSSSGAAIDFVSPVEFNRLTCLASRDGGNAATETEYMGSVRLSSATPDEISEAILGSGELAFTNQFQPITVTSYYSAYHDTEFITATVFLDYQPGQRLPSRTISFSGAANDIYFLEMMESLQIKAVN